MSLQHDRIAELCEQLKLTRLGAEWPALAQDAWTASIRVVGKTTFILAGWLGMNVAG